MWNHTLELWTLVTWVKGSPQRLPSALELGTFLVLQTLLPLSLAHRLLIFWLVSWALLSLDGPSVFTFTVFSNISQQLGWDGKCF